MTASTEPYHEPYRSRRRTVLVILTVLAGCAIWWVGFVQVMIWVWGLVF